MACSQRRCLSITYQSTSSSKPSVREVAPHGLVHDGLRWHTRAYCFRDDVFKDFVLGRILESSLAGEANIDPHSDTDWTETVTLRIAAHPGLSDNQRRVIELDYGMNNGSAEISVRKCVLYYNLKRLGLDTDPDARSPQDQHIVLVNKSEIQTVLGRHES